MKYRVIIILVLGSIFLGIKLSQDKDCDLKCMLDAYMTAENITDEIIEDDM